MLLATPGRKNTLSESLTLKSKVLHLHNAAARNRLSHPPQTGMSLTGLRLFLKQTVAPRIQLRIQLHDKRQSQYPKRLLQV